MCIMKESVLNLKGIKQQYIGSPTSELSAIT